MLNGLVGAALAAGGDGVVAMKDPHPQRTRDSARTGDGVGHWRACLDERRGPLLAPGRTSPVHASRV